LVFELIPLPPSLRKRRGSEAGFTLNSLDFIHETPLSFQKRGPGSEFMRFHKLI